MIYKTKITEVCAKCPLDAENRTFVPDSGTEGGILFVGLAPGKEEEEHSPPTPFVGASGQVLRDALKRIGILDKSFFVNQVHCRPTTVSTNAQTGRQYVSNRDPTQKEYKACAFYFKESLKSLNYKVIVALGGPALKALTGVTGIVKHHGEVFYSQDCGYVVANYHPSYVMRNMNDKKMGPKTAAAFEAALLKAKNFLREPSDVEIETKDYKIVLDQEELVPIINEIMAKKLFAIDYETTSLDPHVAELIGFSISTQPRQGYYIPIINPNVPDQHEKVGIDLDLAIKVINTLVSTPALKSIAHNKSYEYQVSKKYGIQWNQLTYDSYIAYMLTGRVASKALKRLAEQLIDPKAGDYERAIHAYMSEHECTHYGQIPLSLMAPYAASDADYTFDIHLKSYQEVCDKGMKFLYEEIEMPVTEVLADMEYNGVFVNTPYYYALKNEYEDEIVGLEAEIFSVAGQEFNLNSSQQLGDFLYNKLKLPVTKMTVGGLASTDKDALLLNHTKHPIIPLLLKRKKLSKFLTTFIKSLTSAEDGWLYPEIFQSVSTGRLAYSGPNLQNIPYRTDKKMRGGFVAPQGYHFYSADMSQLELRILAHMSKDPNMIKIYLEGGDIHQATGEEIFGRKEISKAERVVCKTINFGIDYGAQEDKLLEALREEGITNFSRSQMTEFIRGYFRRYPRVKSYMAAMVSACKMDGYVETICGRRSYIQGIDDRDLRKRYYAEHQAYNHPIQSSASDILKVGMVPLYKMLQGTRSRMVLQVHDELIFYVHPDDKKGGIEKEILDIMSNPPYIELRVPLVAEGDYVSSWMEK